MIGRTVLASRAIVIVTAGCGVLLAAAVLPFKAQAVDHTLGETIFGGTAGVLFLGAGVVAHLRRPDNNVGLLMVLVGLGWFAEDLQFTRLPVTYTAGAMLYAASGGFIAHLVVAFPDGRLSTRGQRWLVGAAYATAFGLSPLQVVFVDPLFYDQEHPPNLLLVWPGHPMEEVFVSVLGVIGAVLSAAVVVVLARRWLSASGPRRRVLAPVLLTSLIGGLGLMIHSALEYTDLSPHIWMLVYRVSFCVLPLAFLAGLLRVRLGRAGVAALLVELQRPLSASDLRDRLATALGDQSLQIGYWRPGAGRLVDAQGLALDPPSPDSGRVVTNVDREGRRVAGLIHDAAVCEDEHVLRAVTAAAGLTLDNQRLTAEIRAQLGEVHASRARIVAAVTEERRRVERDLHDGVQQGLVAAAIGVRAVAQRLGPSGDEEIRTLLRVCGEGIDTALADLRALARGLHPAILSEDGLVAALTALIERTPVAVELDVTPVPRLPAPIESTAYLVVAEALTNTMKHAGAGYVWVSVAHQDRCLRVEVRDDGAGGADPNGSGLLGLADRVRALDGELVIRSEPAQGTTVTASLPWSGV